jgi:predicted transcriptional regulator
VDDRPKVKIKLKAFVNDLRGGLDDRTLMEKHNLSEAMLPKVINQLVAAGHISEEDLAARNVLDSTQKVVDLFSHPFGSNDEQ